MSDEPGEVPPTQETSAPERTARRAPDVRTAPATDSRIGVGEGFKFGCGFLMALGIAVLVGLLALSAGFLIASLLGIPLPVRGG